MAIESTKLLLLGTAAASAGGVGVAANHAFSHSSKEEKVKNLKTDSIPESPKPKKCLIFVAGEVTGTGTDIKLGKILSQTEGAEDFLKNKTVSESFAKDVKEACEGKRVGIREKEEEFNVYVYQKTDSTQAWNYTIHMQKEDWISKKEIIDNSQDVLKSTLTNQ
ncbi:hypothetical protein HF1_10800 [Mycoplasma haemofelis str. Langford 1]|uniref:Uncharacterized protein n=1 Tax=Mycoplasma haemofelis (strain Langford 1) TaxID=941640 RepID=E8ZIW7_MYCHL|nr:hypothetical protein [Mycoplasma haemofelis]CBY93088.1 hypothetical protein HF1_10800 [Mycoplasma haemofelis str. Langford 1]